MGAQNLPPFRPKAAVSVTTMARAVGLSRSQFYNYIRRGVFPSPLYSTTTKRPYYPADLQEKILEARETGIGCNGEFVMFYERRVASAKPSNPLKRTSHAALIRGLESLGMTNVAHSQIDAALVVLFPNGVDGVDETVVLRSVYRQLRRADGGR